MLDNKPIQSQTASNSGYVHDIPGINNTAPLNNTNTLMEIEPIFLNANSISKSDNNKNNIRNDTQAYHPGDVNKVKDYSDNNNTIVNVFKARKVKKRIGENDPRRYEDI